MLFVNYKQAIKLRLQVLPADDVIGEQSVGAADLVVVQQHLEFRQLRRVVKRFQNAVFVELVVGIAASALPRVVYTLLNEVSPV